MAGVCQAGGGVYQARGWPSRHSCAETIVIAPHSNCIPPYHSPTLPHSQIDKKEFRQAIKALGFDFATKEIDMVFDDFDVDKSGSIEYKELNKMLRIGAGDMPRDAEDRSR